MVEERLLIQIRIAALVLRRALVLRTHLFHRFISIVTKVFAYSKQSDRTAVYLAGGMQKRERRYSQKDQRHTMEVPLCHLAETRVWFSQE